MAHALIEDGVVIQIDLSGNPPDGYVEVPDDIQPGFTLQNGQFASPEPPPYEPSMDDYRLTIQSFLDEKAQKRGYDNGHTIATYINSAVQPWAEEAKSFVAWRDTVWLFAFGELAKFEAGDRSPPTPTEFIEELPEFDWP